MSNSVNLIQGNFEAEQGADGRWLLHVVNVSSSTGPGTTDPITTGTTATVVRAIMMGKTDENNFINIPVTPIEGHIEAAIHGPILPFRSVHVESLRPLFHSDGIYGVNNYSVYPNTGISVGTGTASSGLVTGTNDAVVVKTGTTPYSFASIQSRRRLRYHPGQGIIGRFAGFFSNPVNASIMVAGLGTAETTFAFGYSGTTFGVLHSTGGVREVHTLSITTPSTSTQPYRITMPSGENVFVTGTNNSSTSQTAYEISLGTFPGYTVESVDSAVLFLANSVGNKTGNFVLAQPGAVTPAAGTDVETLAGAAGTDTWIPQSQWNGDVMDGSGSSSNPSGFNLNPQKGNVYQISVQLGYGCVNFDILTINPNSNNHEYITVHTIKYPNTSTTPLARQPGFPFLAAVYSLGSSTDISINIATFSGFNEGEYLYLGPRSSFSLDGTVTTSTTVFKPLFTVRNSLVFKGKANQTVIRLLDVSGDVSGNTNARTKFYLVRNPVLTGPVNFVPYSDFSCAHIDTAATGMVAPNNRDIIWTRSLGQTNDFEYALSDREVTLQPGESMTLCVKSLSATATVTGALNTREDQ